MSMTSFRPQGIRKNVADAKRKLMRPKPAGIMLKFEDFDAAFPGKPDN